MLQLTRITAPGVDMQYAYPQGTNNGQITQENDGVYTYDSLKRLVRAETTGPEWGQAFAYDGFGNMTQKTRTKGSGAPEISVSYDASNHRTGVRHDANGNQLSSVTPPYGEQYTWTVENRLASVTGGGGPPMSCGYDPWGECVFEGSSADGGWVRFVSYGVDGKALGAQGWRRTGTASGWVVDSARRSATGPE